YTTVMRRTWQVKTANKPCVHRCTFLVMALFMLLASGETTKSRRGGQACRDMADAAKERRHEARHSPPAPGGEPVSSGVQEIPPDVLVVLALPPLDALTDGQRRGATCVWHGGERLTGERAVALGEHMSPLRGSTSPMRWFPRACHTCVADRAHHGL